MYTHEDNIRHKVTQALGGSTTRELLIRQFAYMILQRLRAGYVNRENQFHYYSSIWWIRESIAFDSTNYFNDFFPHSLVYPFQLLLSCSSNNH